MDFQNQSLHPPDTQSMISGAGSKGCAKASFPPSALDKS